MPAGDDRKRTRSPAYPFIDLEEAIHYAKLAYSKEEHHAFAPEAAAVHWEYKATSSAVSQIVSALKQFGLLIEEPGNGGRKVRLSPLALDLMVHEDESNPQRRPLLKTAALNPKIHREIWDKYGGRLPSDPSLRIYLLREREGVPFNKDQVDKFISQLRETIEFAKLTESDKLPPADDEATDHADAHDMPRSERQQSPTLGRRPRQPGTKEDVFTLDEGAVVLQYPERLSPESFDDFEAWLQLIIRKAKRSVVQTDEEEAGEE
jgi:hypothetical protein